MSDNNKKDYEEIVSGIKNSLFSNFITKTRNIESVQQYLRPIIQRIIKLRYRLSKSKEKQNKDSRILQANDHADETRSKIKKIENDLIIETTKLKNMMSKEFYEQSKRTSITLYSYLQLPYSPNKWDQNIQTRQNFEILYYVQKSGNLYLIKQIQNIMHVLDFEFQSFPRYKQENITFYDIYRYHQDLFGKRDQNRFIISAYLYYIGLNILFFVKQFLLQNQQNEKLKNRIIDLCKYVKYINIFLSINLFQTQQKEEKAIYEKFYEELVQQAKNFYSVAFDVNIYHGIQLDQDQSENNNFIQMNYISSAFYSVLFRTAYSDFDNFDPYSDIQKYIQKDDIKLSGQYLQTQRKIYDIMAQKDGDKQFTLKKYEYRLEIKNPRDPKDPTKEIWPTYGISPLEEVKAGEEAVPKYLKEDDHEAIFETIKQFNQAKSDYKQKGDLHYYNFYPGFVQPPQTQYLNLYSIQDKNQQKPQKDLGYVMNFLEYNEYMEWLEPRKKDMQTSMARYFQQRYEQFYDFFLQNDDLIDFQQIQIKTQEQTLNEGRLMKSIFKSLKDTKDDLFIDHRDSSKLLIRIKTSIDSNKFRYEQYKIISNFEKCKKLQIQKSDNQNTKEMIEKLTRIQEQLKKDTVPIIGGSQQNFRQLNSRYKKFFQLAENVDTSLFLSRLIQLYDDEIQQDLFDQYMLKQKKNIQGIKSNILLQQKIKQIQNPILQYFGNRILEYQTKDPIDNFLKIFNISYFISFEQRSSIYINKEINDKEISSFLHKNIPYVMQLYNICMDKTFFEKFDVDRFLKTFDINNEYIRNLLMNIVYINIYMIDTDNQEKYLELEEMAIDPQKLISILENVVEDTKEQTTTKIPKKDEYIPI